VGPPVSAGSAVTVISIVTTAPSLSVAVTVTL
jgi:hypothetical protein